jgi:hypothetical protein
MTTLLFHIEDQDENCHVTDYNNNAVNGAALWLSTQQFEWSSSNSIHALLDGFKARCAGYGCEAIVVREFCGVIFSKCNGDYERAKIAADCAVWAFFNGRLAQMELTEK